MAEEIQHLLEMEDLEAFAAAAAAAAVDAQSTYKELLEEMEVMEAFLEEVAAEAILLKDQAILAPRHMEGEGLEPLLGHLQVELKGASAVALEGLVSILTSEMEVLEVLELEEVEQTAYLVFQVLEALEDSVEALAEMEM